MGRIRTSRARTATLVVALALLAAGCAQADGARPDEAGRDVAGSAPVRRAASSGSGIELLTSPTRAQRESTPPPLELVQRYVTRDAADTYAVHAGTTTLQVLAPATNVATADGSQTRSVLWDPTRPAQVDQRSCATWTEAHGRWAQQGLALRVQVEAERFRTIVVAKNVWYGAEWQMNVYTWDNARDPYFRTHGMVSLREPFERLALPMPLPWRVCARVVGAKVQVKGWRPSEPEPSWDDPTHGGSVLLPAEWIYEGRPGWYAGHLQPGGGIAMADLRTAD